MIGKMVQDMFGTGIILDMTSSGREVLVKWDDGEQTWELLCELHVTV